MNIGRNEKQTFDYGQQLILLNKQGAGELSYFYSDGRCSAIKDKILLANCRRYFPHTFFQIKRDEFCVFQKIEREDEEKLFSSLVAFAKLVLFLQASYLCAWDVFLCESGYESQHRKFFDEFNRHIKSYDYLSEVEKLVSENS